MLTALQFAAEAIAPIIALVVIGYVIKRIGMVNGSFCQIANKLVFRLFLPASLFLNVYRIPDIGSIEIGYILYALAATLLIFLLGIPAVYFFTKHNDRRGPTLQATFRSNFALVGIPLAGALFGTEGMMIASLLSAAVIPLFNVLAVVSLSLFSGGTKRPSAKSILLDILKNPLIISIAAGIVALAVRALLVRGDITWRLTDVGPVYDVLSYLSSVATPLALLVLGMQFEFSTAREMRREIVFGTMARVVVAPLFGIGVAFLFFRNHFSGAHFATFVSLFATPVAVSSVPMTQEMGGNTPLAGQFVVFTTLLSALSIFIASFLLRLAGVL
ncbi:MAG: AEC family transporter [Ruminococcaceae bacterium]|nr:AEC family transporter [Oscillospiraceae bacterium]